MLAKQLEYLGEADAAGIVLGARVPIILTSRAGQYPDPPRLLRYGAVITCTTNNPQRYQPCDSNRQFRFIQHQIHTLPRQGRT